MNVLAIGAHFDDVELGCGGSIVRHVKQGDNVYIYVATDSGYGTCNGRPIRNKNIAKQEGEASARLLGAELICGKQETYHLEFTEEVNSELVRIIEEKKIELIYTHWIGDTHHDHYGLAKASLHASRHVPNVLAYRSNWYIGSDAFKGNFFIDISETWEVKKQAIMCHQSEYSRVGETWIEYFEREALNNGLKTGVKYAETFEMIKWRI